MSVMSSVKLMYVKQYVFKLLMCLQHAAVVDLNAVNVGDEHVTPSTDQTTKTELLDNRVLSSEDVVQLPQSRVIMATAEPPRLVKSGEVAREKNVNHAVRSQVKSNNGLRCRKRQSSFSGLRSKRLKRDQKHKRETTSATWTESMFVSGSAEVDGDVSKVASAIDTEELNAVASSVATSSVVTSSPIVSDGGQLKITSQQNPVCSTKSPSEVITTVDSNLRGTLLYPSASGQTSVYKDGVCPGAVTDDAAEDCKPKIGVSSSVRTHVSKSPPAVQHTLLTELHSSMPDCSPSTILHMVRTSLHVSLSPSSGSSTSKTMILAPVHATSENVSPTSVCQVRPTPNICKMQAATDKPASIMVAEQQHSDGTSTSVTSRIPPQFQSPMRSVDSDLPSTSKSVIRVVLPPPQSTSLRGSTVLVRGQQFRPKNRVLSESEHLTASCVRQPHPSLPVVARQRCSVSAGDVALQRPTLSPASGQSDSHCSLRTMMRPRVAPAQPIRIRINASDLGNTADPAAVMNHVRGILSRTNTMLPGAQIRIRYMPPPTTTAARALPAQSSSAPQTTASENVNTRVSQLDGTADSDDDSQTAAVKQSKSASQTAAGDGVENVSTVHSRRRSKATDADEPAADSRVR